MFLEKFLSHKTGKQILEPNISSWRRAVCGDLTSVFKPFNGEKVTLPDFVRKDEFVESIHKAQFKPLPSMPSPLATNDVAAIVRDQSAASKMPKQEIGTRPSRPLPYELIVSGKVNADKKTFQLTFESRNHAFGERTAGAPFIVYALGKEWATRSYAVAPGESVTDSWSLENFPNGDYHFRADGPNGFFREWKGNANDAIVVDVGYEADKHKMLTGNVLVFATSKMTEAAKIEVVDNAYGNPPISKSLAVNAVTTIPQNLASTSGWYDSTVRVAGTKLEFRFAGRVETGKEGITDPAIGKVDA
jgi:phospholipase C